jgi:uncharacterized protein YyaL (SSP411 family)
VERTLKAFDTIMQRSPAGCPSLLAALKEYLHPPTIIIVRGSEAVMKSWRSSLDQLYMPETLCFFLPHTLTDLPQGLARECSGMVNAWVCSGVECSAPIQDLDVLLRQL